VRDAAVIQTLSMKISPLIVFINISPGNPHSSHYWQQFFTSLIRLYLPTSTYWDI